MRRAVLFDLFHTLVPGGSAGLRHAVTLTMGGVLGVDRDDYAAAFHQAWPERFVGALGDLPDTVAAIAGRVGGRPTRAQVSQAAALRRAMTAELLSQVRPDTLDTLDKLRSDGWLVGLVSNTTAESPDRFRDSPLATRFHAAAFSSELGVAKPDPDIYLAVCRQLGVEPTACVYVGDGADRELAAAASLGMHAIRTVEHHDSDPDWTGPVIGRLAELASMDLR